ncbi:C40 family peptidase [Anaerococcus porci]|uniref:C40 family peptidase n=1 Tax=Anaerococcus porci TaxID=2652269 RepID=UPI002A75BF31|nr:C40 family peptidase [Anaerococcus porci]MDY3006517.1 C40 family peptidase [Anaerococcus porci]
MKKSKKIILLLTTALSFGIFGTMEKSEAKSLIINYDLTEGVNVRKDDSDNDNSNILGGIDYPDIYEIKGETEDYYQIEFEGKKAYVGKYWFHILDDIKALKDTKIYEKNDESSNKISDIKKDEQLTLVDFDENKDFVKVKKDDKEGFVKIEDFDLSTKDEKDLDKLKEKYKKIYESIKRYIDYLKRNGLSLYPEGEDKAEENDQIRRIYPEKTAYEESSETRDIEYIYYTVDDNDIGKSAYNFATKFLGNPYVFGGIDLVNGIDCSGFTMQVYSEFGIGLPHLAQTQSNYGKTIALGEEKAGDLVFFGTSLSNITHVAIADGQGGIIHAANPRAGVITSSIGNPILIKRLIEN